jgi:hypothetical protein
VVPTAKSSASCLPPNRLTLDNFLRAIGKESEPPPPAKARPSPQLHLF